MRESGKILSRAFFVHLKLYFYPRIIFQGTSLRASPRNRKVTKKMCENLNATLNHINLHEKTDTKSARHGRFVV